MITSMYLTAVTTANGVLKQNLTEDEMRTAVRQAVEEMLLNDAAPEDVLADAEAEITEAIERYEEENF